MHLAASQLAEPAHQAASQPAEPARQAEPVQQAASQPAELVPNDPSEPASLPNDNKDPAHSEQHTAAPVQLQPETHPAPSLVTSGGTQNTADKGPSNAQLN